MPTTSNDIVNEALQMMGDNQPPVTGFAPTFDNSTNGIAAQRLYTPCVQFVGRQFGWDFARALVTLALSGNAAPVPWSYEYNYPSNGVQVWQIMPPTISDPNDPRPVRWDRGNTLVGGIQSPVLWTNQQNAIAYYNNQPSEATWDAGFRESVVRYLASEFAVALAGRPETSALLLQTSLQVEKMSEMRGS